MSRKHSKKKLNNYDYKKAFKRKSDISFRKKAGMAFIAANLLIAPAAGTYLGEALGQNNVAEAVSLAEVQLLENVDVNATLTEPVEGQPYNLNLRLNGTGINVDAVNPDETVVFYAPELAGQLTPINTAYVQADILPLTLEGDLPALDTALQGLQSDLTGIVTGLVNDVDATLGILPSSIIEIEGLTELNAAIDNLNNINDALADLLSYQDQVAYTVSPEGYIVVNFNDGLGNYVETAVRDVVQAALNDVSVAANNLDINVLGDADLLGDILGTLTDDVLQPAIGSLTSSVAQTSDSLTSGTVSLANDIAAAQVIGNTIVDLNVAVNNPSGIDGEILVYGAGVTTSVIDVELLSTLVAADTIVFDEDVTAPTLDSADITGNSTDGYTVVGSGAEPGDQVNVSNADGIVGTGVIGEDGTYLVELPGDAVTPGEVLDVQAIDEAGNVSDVLPVTVPEDPDAIAPELNDVTIDGNSTDGYDVNGSTEPGATVSVTDAEGIEVGTGTAGDDGTFIVVLDPGSVTPGDDLTVVATDDEGNDSDPSVVTVPADPDEGDATPPELNDVTIDGNSTDGYDVTGSTEPGSAISVNDSEGIEVGTGIAGDDGTFIVVLDPGVVLPGEDLTVVATDDAGNSSDPAVVTVPLDPDDTDADADA
ncbi:adhesive domain-containing protein, partial [Salinicoccus sesuvii]